MTVPKRTYEAVGGMAVGVNIPGIVSCTGCGWGAKITGADRLPEMTSLFCPTCAAGFGFGDGTQWVEVKRHKRRSGSLRGHRPPSTCLLLNHIDEKDRYGHSSGGPREALASDRAENAPILRRAANIP